MVVSMLAEATRPLSQLTERSVISASCPRQLACSSPVCSDQICAEGAGGWVGRAGRGGQVNGRGGASGRAAGEAVSAGQAIEEVQCRQILRRMEQAVVSVLSAGSPHHLRTRPTACPPALPHTDLPTHNLPPHPTFTSLKVVRAGQDQHKARADTRSRCPLAYQHLHTKLPPSHPASSHPTLTSRSSEPVTT